MAQWLNSIFCEKSMRPQAFLLLVLSLLFPYESCATDERWYFSIVPHRSDRIETLVVTEAGDAKLESSGYAESLKYGRRGDEFSLSFFLGDSFWEFHGKVTGGDVVGVARFANEEFPVTFRSFPDCSGEKVVCASGVFCQTKGKFDRFYLPGLYESRRADLGSVAGFDEFSRLFHCSAVLGAEAILKKFISHDLSIKSYSENNKVKEERLELENFFVKVASRYGIHAYSERDIGILSDKKIGVIKRSEIDEYVSEWLFEEGEFGWLMRGVEVVECLDWCGNKSWFFWKNCRGDNLNFDGAHEDISFRNFLVKFYCSVEGGENKSFLSRVKDSFLYTIDGCEAEPYKEVRSGADFSSVGIDGWQTPLVYGQIEDTANASVHGAGTGMGWRWVFERVGGKWYLIEQHIQNC